MHIKTRTMQTAVENTLSETLDMKFLATEYVTDFGNRIGTLAIDDQGAPVIIMYKQTRTDNVVGQAVSAAKWTQAQSPTFFRILLEDKLGPSASHHLNWGAPRIVCIAEAFSRVDLDTAADLSTVIELFKFRPHTNKAFSLTPVSMERVAA